MVVHLWNDRDPDAAFRKHNESATLLSAIISLLSKRGAATLPGRGQDIKRAGSECRSVYGIPDLSRSPAFTSTGTTQNQADFLNYDLQNQVHFSHYDLQNQADF